ncbi:MAG: hypothetical protein Tsb005_04120 [Gammaproteobacteria bacterium]
MRVQKTATLLLTLKKNASFLLLKSNKEEKTITVKNTNNGNEKMKAAFISSFQIKKLTYASAINRLSEA